jgi:hypothetical protein
MPGLLLLLLGRESSQQFALTGGRWPDSIIEAGNQNALLLIFEGPQSPDEPPGGVGEVTIQTGVRIILDRPYPQLDIHYATATELHVEAAFVVRYTSFPDASVCRKPILVSSDEVTQRRTANLLFALDEKDNAIRQVSIDRSHRIEGGQPRDEFSFVVCGATSKEFVVALHRRKGGRIPLVQGFWRLDIVVVIEQEGALSSPILTIHHGISCGFHHLSRNATRAEQFCNQDRALMHSQPLRGDAGLITKSDQLLHALLNMLLHILIKGGYPVCHHDISCPLGLSLPGD